MTLRNLRWLAVPLAAATTALVMSTGPATSDISIRQPQRLTAVAATQWPELISTQPLSVQCWQEGVQIIAEHGLHGVSVNNLIQRDAVSFKRKDESFPSVHIVALQDSTCLIRAEPETEEEAPNP